MNVTKSTWTTAARRPILLAILLLLVASTFATAVAATMVHLPTGTSSPATAANAPVPSATVSVTPAGSSLHPSYFQGYNVTFRESGLPVAATQWNVTWNTSGTPINTYRSAGGAGLIITIPDVVNGTYTWNTSVTWAYDPTPATGSITVNGANPAATHVRFAAAPPPPGHYTVTFTETGLPFGSSWNVTWNTSGVPVVYRSTGFREDITIANVVNGTYTWNTSVTFGLYPAPSGGSFVVNGPSNTAGGYAQAVVFGPPPGHYTVTFDETGLPNGATWYLTFNGTVYNAAVPFFGGATITITGVVNRTAGYAWNTTYPGYTATPPSGTLPVTGASPPAVDITFALTPGHYSVEFTETGLPITATTWNVTFNGTLYASNGIGFGGPTITISGVVNNSYSFAVAQQYGLYPTPPSGSITVNGANPAAQVINFAGPAAGTQPVWLNETGLPTGTTWSVTFNGATFNSGGSSTILLFEANGNYPYTVTAIPGWTATPSAGTVSVAGAHALVSVVFVKSATVFPTTFTESGLPGGAHWAVTYNGVVDSSNSASITFAPLVNGTYSWNVSAVYHYSPTPMSGTVTIDGGTGGLQTIVFAIVQPTYTANFNAVNLPASTTWSVSIGSNTASGTESSLAIAGLGNGSYTYSVGAVAGYKASPASGSITINGQAATQAITFSPAAVVHTQYEVTFTESGLPAGSTWSVTFNGTTNTASVTTITFSIINGSAWAWTVGSVSGYTPNHGSGTVSVAGSAVSVSIVFTATPATKGSSGLAGAFGGYGLLVIAAVVIAVVAIVAVLLYMRRGKGGASTMAAASAGGAGAGAWASAPATSSDDVGGAASSSAASAWSAAAKGTPSSDEEPASEVHMEEPSASDSTAPDPGASSGSSDAPSSKDDA